MKRFLRNTRGATAIEYAVICAVIFLAMIAGVAAVGDADTGLWGTVSNKVDDAMGDN